MLAVCAAPAAAQERSINVIDLYQGGGFSDLAALAATQGYELSGGEPVALSKWYTPALRELSIDFLTTLDADDGIIWGFSTGEAGEKYTIDPAVRLGIIKQWHPSPRSTLTLTVTTSLWGHFSEKTCEGDFTSIGEGIETVNCRLAASTIPVDETLQYLWDQDPSRLKIMLSYVVSF